MTDTTPLVPWRERLRHAPAPRVVCDGAVHDGAALHAGAEGCRTALQAAGLAPGDRVLLALPPGPAFASRLLGALRLGLTVALAPPGSGASLVDEVDARLLLDDERLAPRRARGVPTPDARFLVRTSGSTGAPRWIALSDANVQAVLDSHDHALPAAGGVVASVLPWHHVFGLVMELLPALARASVLVRDPTGGRDAAALLALARAHEATHLAAVPATLARLLDVPGGRAWLHALAGGLTGGAPVSAALAAGLAGSRLRIGYGQTEAAPGIALSEAGDWRPRYLGRPLGCEVRLDEDGQLAFRGPNAALGEWRDGALVREPAGRWVRTGDVVRADGNDLYFAGRANATFKLANGRWVTAHGVEAALHARVPSLQEAMLGTEDGATLVLACTTTDGQPPSDDAVRDALGALASLPWAVRMVPADAWTRSPKGELDRRAGLPVAVRD